MHVDSSRRLRRRLSSFPILLILSLALLSTVFVPPTPAHLYSPPTTGVIVPLMMYPNAAWQALASYKQAHPNVPVAAIINPAGGPGTSKDNNFVNGIATLHAAGVLVLGYVYSSYTSRALSAVEADVSTYHSWYSVDGIMVDEMMNIAGYESYYSQLTAYAHTFGYYVVGNPGAPVPYSYIGTADSILVYESPGAPPNWVLTEYAGYPKAGFGICAYGIPTLNLTYLSYASNYLGWIYLTDGVLPNPYSSLSSYLPSMLAALEPAAPPPGLTLSIGTADLTGASFGGIWATVQSGGSTVASGFTPLSLSVTSGTQYSVTVTNYGSFVFDHWSTGSTSATVTVTPTASTSLTAYYRTAGGAGKVALNVTSADLNGTPIPGLWATIQANGSTVSSGYTPLSYSATSGSRYTVTVSSYGSYVFNHWSDGTTNSSIVVTPTSATSLVGFFSTPATPATVALTVKSANLTGSAVNGLYVTIQSGGKTVGTGFTPYTFNANVSVQYTITAYNYSPYIFNRWSTGATTSSVNVSLTTATTLTAFYSG